MASQHFVPSFEVYEAAGNTFTPPHVEVLPTDLKDTAGLLAELRSPRTRLGKYLNEQIAAVLNTGWPALRDRLEAAQDGARQADLALQATLDALNRVFERRPV